MKEQLLQLKQDIVDISNDLINNLADKGVDATGTLSELVDQVKDIQGGYNPLAEIGWNLSEQPYLKDAIEYAQEILVNPKSTYQNDKRLVIFPKVDELQLKDRIFYGSNLLLFPDGVKLTGNFQYSFQESNIINLDLSQADIKGNIGWMFYGCGSLINLKLPDNFGEGITNYQYLFNNCYKLQSPIKVHIDSNITTLNSMFYYCKSLKSVIITGDITNITNTGSMFSNCGQLEYLSFPDKFPITNNQFIYTSLSNLKRIDGSVVYKGETNSTYSKWIWAFYQNKCTRYMVVKDIGIDSKYDYINMEYSQVWGIANDEVPDARQSLIDSLITYSFDRAAAGYNTMTMKLYTDVKALLTDDEIAQITAKGYTLI